MFCLFLFIIHSINKLTFLIIITSVVILNIQAYIVSNADRVAIVITLVNNMVKNLTEYLITTKIELIKVKTSFKEAKSATMNIFLEKKYFLFKSLVKVELSYVFTINAFTIAETARKSELSYKIGVCFLFLVIICVPPIIIDS